MAGALALGLMILGATIEWSAPKACASRAEMEERMAAEGLESAAVVRAEVRATGSAFELELSVASDARTLGRRALRAGRCAELEAATLFLARLVLEGATGEATAGTAPLEAPTSRAELVPSPQPWIRPERAPKAEPASEVMAEPALAHAPRDAAALASATEPAPREPIVSASSVERPPAAPLRGAARLSLLGDVGSLPGPTAGLDARVAARWAPLRLELGARVLLPSTAKLEAAPAASGRFLLIAGTAAGCGELFDRISLCAGLELGALSAEGQGVDSPQATTELHRAFSLSAAGMLPLGPLRLVLELGLVAPLYRPRFVLDGLGELHRAAPVSGRLALGVEADVL